MSTEDAWLPTTTPMGSGSEAVATIPAELGHRLQPSLVGVGSSVAVHAGGPLCVLDPGSWVSRGCLLSSVSGPEPAVLTVYLSGRPDMPRIHMQVLCCAVVRCVALRCLALPCVALLSVAARSGGVDHCVIPFEGCSCTKVEQVDMRSVRWGGGCFVSWGPSLAMTGRDKLRMVMAGLGRTGHLSALLIRSDGRREQHPQEASHPTP